MRASIAVRERPHDLIHSTGRRLRAHVVPFEHPSEAALLDRASGGALLALARRVHDKGQEPVQEAQHGQQRRDRHPSSVRRRRAQVQDHHWLLQVRAREMRHCLDYQVVPWWKRVPHERSL